ncbi:MAG: hypothetical protein EON93_02430 [Burkholderiales bacterium]|nr:MAG: hypothetical protein EON93_02430 [Burkholderiales bacterium]
MRILSVVALLAASFASPAFAQSNCVGSANFKTCTDQSGNSYSVSRFGNSTQVQGNNPSTGSTWSQSSTTLGNNTYTNGTAANGKPWNQTTSTFGNTTSTYGTDSNGQSFSKTCSRIGTTTSCY